jgi:outer membrane protein OmpA-like peptidoglycan-associated protein
MNIKTTFFTSAVLLLAMSSCSNQSQKKPSDETIGLGQENQMKPTNSQPLLSQYELEQRFEPIYFRFDSSELQKNAQKKIEKMANFIKMADLDKPIMINGHTDPVGTKTYNYILGQQRAKTVRDHLIELGVAPKNLKTVSYGEATLVNQRVTHHSELRRVEFTFNEQDLKNEMQKIGFRRN